MFHILKKLCICHNIHSKVILDHCNFWLFFHQKFSNLQWNLFRTDPYAWCKLSICEAHFLWILGKFFLAWCTMNEEAHLFWMQSGTSSKSSRLTFGRTYLALLRLIWDCTWYLIFLQSISRASVLHSFPRSFSEQVH